MAKSMDPIIRLAMEGRILCLDVLSGIVLALPESSRSLLLGWLADDLDRMDKVPPAAQNDPAHWRDLMDNDPRSPAQGGTPRDR